MSLKEQFIRLALSKTQTFKSLCSVFKISRQTGYKLLKRYRQSGLKALQSNSKKPHNSPRRTSRRIEELVLSVRERNPTWGGRKIKNHLERMKKTSPSASTITEILRRNGYLEEEECLKRKALGRFERLASNELWQVDFKGRFKLLDENRCFPLTFLDDHSRFSLGIRACPDEQCKTVKHHFIEVFEHYGLPDQINFDNGNPWGSSTGHRYTQFSVWLMRLGIKVTHSRVRHPQTNGKNERFNRTLKEDVILRNEIKNMRHAQKLFDEWRDIYNYERPHEGINMARPYERYKPSSKPLPNKLEPIEYADDALVRKVRGNGYTSYRNKEYLVGEAFKGFYIEIKADDLGQHLEIYFGRNKIYEYEQKE